MKKRPVITFVILGLLGIGLFLLGSGYVFHKSCVRREYVWPDPDPADEMQQEQYAQARRLQEQKGQSITITAFDGTKLKGHYFEREKNAPLVIFFHGLWSDGYVDGVTISRITQHNNWNLLLADLRAHHESAGTISTLGVRERYDCRDWANWAASNWGEKTPIYLMGISMGGAAVMMSSNLELPDSVCGIIDDCGYTTPMEMIGRNCEEKLPKWIPISAFAFVVDAGTRIWGGFRLEEADACKALSQTDIPILIIHGDKDTIAPISMAYRLYDSCKSEKQLYIVHGADHAEGYWKDPEGYERVVTEFIEGHIR